MGLVRYVFSLPEVKENQLALLSQHICQDPLENFFGCQRQRGGTSDNPSAQEYYISKCTGTPSCELFLPGSSEGKLPGGPK